MTTTSPGSAALAELVRVHGADLHRVAAMLTGGEAPATSLTARTLADRDPASTVSPDQLRTDLVRTFLRAAPRRPEGVLSSEDDVGDVLRHLRPRARAAAVLQLVEGWDVERTAAAVGVSRSRVGGLVPSVPGLDLALVAVGDQHALAGHELEAAVLAATPAAGRPRGRRRGRDLAIVAGLAGALAAGLLMAEDRGDGGQPGDAEESPEALTTIGATDLTEAGWRLTDDGDPPGSVNGMRLREKVVLDQGRRRTPVSVPHAPSFVFASFGVLWCDMPPAEDDHLAVPTGTLTVDGAEITLPCAGREGAPPVTQVVPLPPGGEGALELTGDMPGDGVATLGIYQEADGGYAVPSARGELTAGPPVADDAVELDVSAGGPSTYYGWRAVQSVSVGHESTIRVWAGRTGSVAVNVDGVPATDDGDVAAWMAASGAQLEEPTEDSEAGIFDPREYADWSRQQVDVRNGQWLVQAPDMVRTFALPSDVRPGPGERRTVAVEVMTENVEDHLQVVVAGARPATVDTAPVAELTVPDAPLLVAGHRLVGQWELPSDGHLRELMLNGSRAVPEETVLLAVRAPDPAAWSAWGDGMVTRGDTAAPLWVQGDLATALRELNQPQFAQVPSGPGPLSAASPPAPGHPAATILAYAPVPYEEFDFSEATVPPDAWPAGARPPDPHSLSYLGPQETVETIEPEDLRDGEVTVHVEPVGEVTVQATTTGRGRIRFLVDGRPADGVWSSDGWWSSWTERPVTSQLLVSHATSPSPSEIELTVVVEDYADFSLQVRTG